MRISVISFTTQGAQTECAVLKSLRGRGHDVKGYAKKTQERQGASTLLPLEEKLSQWTAQRFSDSGALVFIGAMGIAVRAVAPYIKSKTQDPAVIVVDEQGTFCISLLSGHIGGANDLARQIAQDIQAMPVVTTATDINGKIAVDQWAREQNCFISDMTCAKDISAAVLEGQTVGFYSDYPVQGMLPKELSLVSQEDISAAADKENHRFPCGITVSIARRSESLHFADRTLQLVPRTVTLGIGCRRDTPFHKLSAFAEEMLVRENIRWEAVAAIATIDLKKDEAGLLALARLRGVPLLTYSAEELKKVAGSFTPSSFVNSVTGVDNVCERAAVKGERAKTLICVKEARDGMTIAMAEDDFYCTFREV